MKRKPDEEEPTDSTIELPEVTQLPQHYFDGVKRYKSDIEKPTFDVIEYEYRLTEYYLKRAASTGNLLNERLADSFFIFDETEILRKEGSKIYSAETKSSTDSYTSAETDGSYETNSSAETDALTKKERELAHSNAREPGYRLHQGKYDPSNLENLPEVKVKVKSRIEPELDCDKLFKTDFSDLVKLLKDNSNTTAPLSSNESEEGDTDEGFSVENKEIEVTAAAATTTTTTTITTTTTTTTTTTITEEIDTTTITKTTEEEQEEEEEKKTEQLSITINTAK